MTSYLKHTFDNGIRVIAEKIDTVLSVSIGYFLRSGVLFEKPEAQGVSHFIEHMLFKGTNKRSARSIASEFDRIGGYINAFTAKDHCCFYARVVKDKLPVAVDVLSDMVMNSRFEEPELERERGVILEEIKMYEDSPDEIIHELIGKNIWKGSRLKNPILGTASSIAKIKRADIYEVFKKQYVANNLVICAAGNFCWSKLLKILEKHLKKMRAAPFCPKETAPVSSRGVSLYQKEIEQVHLTIGRSGLPFNNAKRYPVTLLNAALGGGMSSRLFQEIREKRGLAYTVYSYHTSFRKAGLFGIYAATSMKNLEKVIKLIHSELKKLAQKGIKQKELEDIREQLKGNLLIALESTANRMNRLAAGFLYGVEAQPPEELIKPYLKVTVDDIKEAACELLNIENMSLTMIVPSLDAAKALKGTAFESCQPILKHLSKKQQNKGAKTK